MEVSRISPNTWVPTHVPARGSSVQVANKCVTETYWGVGSFSLGTLVGGAEYVETRGWHLARHNEAQGSQEPRTQGP